MLGSIIVDAINNGTPPDICGVYCPIHKRAYSMGISIPPVASPQWGFLSNWITSDGHLDDDMNVTLPIEE